MVSRLAVIVFVFYCQPVFSQQTFTEFDLPKGHDPTKIQFLSLNKMAVLLYQTPFAPTNSKEGFRKFNAWLVDDQGETRKLNMDFFGDKVICGAVESEEQILFYYFEQERKNILIKAANLNLRSNEVAPLDAALIVPGKFIGGNVKGDRLFIYAFERNTYLLKVLDVQLLEIKSEKNYKLAVDLSKFRASEIAFIPETTQVGSAQATAKVKVMPQGEHIRIVVDEPFKDYEERVHLYKTTAIDIDSQTGQSTIRVFAEETRNQFRSIIYDGYVFRTVNTFSEFRLQIFDFMKGSEVYRQTLPRDDASKKISVTFRENSTNHFSGEAKLYDMISGADVCLPFLAVSKNESNDKFIITWGTYFERNSMAPIGPDLVGMMVGIGGTAIFSAMDGPGETRHFDLEGNIEAGFKIVQGQNDFPTRRKIDVFESEQNVNRLKYRRKGYFQYAGTTLALYYFPSLNKLSFIEFKQ